MGEPANVKKKGLLERLRDGETVICAEGYVLELEERCYLQAGFWIPEVTVRHPDVLRGLHREFVHAGSDVVLACTFFAHREKLKQIGLEDELENINRTALRIAREVAEETGTMMAGNICTTLIYDKDDSSCEEQINDMFKEQLTWAVEEGAEFIVAETFDQYGEALLALKAIKKYAKGLPAVVTMAFHASPVSFDGVSIEDCMKGLEAAGADVVGLNCARSPDLTQPFLKKVRDAVKIPVAALPVCYRGTEEHPTFNSVPCPDGGERAMVDSIAYWSCTRGEIARFGEACKTMGVKYIGLCCGNKAAYTRKLAETVGRTPPACRYSPTKERLHTYGTKKHYKDFMEQRKLTDKPVYKADIVQT